MGELPDGRKVFVPFGIPGEKLRIRITEEKKRFCYGTIIDVLTPSSLRIKPRCKHFSICGGCHFQHLSYDDQLRVKENILKEQLKRFANLENYPMEPIYPSTREWNYRNYIQFHPSSSGKMAYLSAGTNDSVEIDECFLMEPVIDHLWRNITFEPDSGVSEISWRVNDQEEVLFMIEGMEEIPPEFDVDFPLNAVYLGANGPVALSGEPFLLYDIRQKIYKVSAESFFQVNTEMISPIVEKILSYIQPEHHDCLLDIYCGVGLFSKLLAPFFNRCIGIEISISAVDDYVANLDEFDNIEVYLGSAEDVLPSLDVNPDVILVDPPRSGIANRAIEKIIQMRSKLIVYISCDPSSFARDTEKITKSGYHLQNIVPFDMFPQTHHLETVGFFTCNNE